MKAMNQMLTIGKINLWRYHVKMAFHAAFIKDPACMSLLPVDAFGRRLKV